MKKRPLSQLQKFQKDLYQKAFLEAASLPLIDAPAIIKYSEKFYESLPKTFKKTDIARILHDLDSSQFLLYGDFHTLKQTQKGLIRLLREYINYRPQRKLVLALEMFKARDQELIDRYLKGDLSEQQFLQLCQYDYTWGFPWENYRIIMDFAVKQSIRIVGINTDLAGKEELKSRDRFAAKILEDIYHQDQKALVVCLIGEFHLADQHLPKYFNENHTITRVLTNIDHLYFLSSNSSEVPTTEYLALKPRLYCILNSPPWIKWQSYAIWEEMKSVEDSIGDSGMKSRVLYTEETFDLDYQLLNLMTHLSEFLKLDFRKSDLTRFSTYLEPSESELLYLIETNGLGLKLMETIKERLERDGFFLIPECNAILIQEVSLNSIAEAAGQYLFNLLHPTDTDLSPSKQSYHRILMTSSGVLASKILNPRRRGHDQSHYESLLQQLERRRLIGYQKKFRDVIRIVLKSLNRMRANPQLGIHYTTIRYDHDQHMEVSVRLGQVIGYETYRTIMKNSNQSLEFNYFFQFSTQAIGPKEQLLHLIGCLDHS